MQTAIVVMSKVPQPGFGKTRLNAVMSETESADFHRACLLDTCRGIMKTGLPGYIYYLPADVNNPSAGTGEMVKNGLALPAREQSYFLLCPQQGADLGERLYYAVRETLVRHEAVIFLGSDTPWTMPDLLLEARDLLAGSDVVIGPACDGGYYLLAIKTDCPDLFADIPWGTSQVFEKTVTVIRKKNLACSLLPTRSDIDTWDDLLSFYQSGMTDVNKYYQSLEAYKLAAGLVKRYGEQEEGVGWLQAVEHSRCLMLDNKKV